MEFTPDRELTLERCFIPRPVQAMEFTPDRELTHLKSVFAHEFFDGTYSRQGIETFVFPVEIFNVGMELTPARELKRVIPDSVLIF